MQLLFVLLAQLVCKQAMDDNAYWLAENARKFMIENAVTKSYFGGSNYVMTAGVVEVGGREVKDAPAVSCRIFPSGRLRL